MDRIVYLPFCLILLFSTVPSASAFTLKDFETELTRAVSGNMYGYVGDEMRITCTLSSEALKNSTSQDIRFHKLKPELCLPKDHVVAVNTSTAVLTLPNATVSDAGLYSCFAGENCEKFIGMMSDPMKIEYPPHNVTDFRCIASNWNDYILCTWQHPVQYVDWSNIQVKSTYNSWPCPNPTIKSCQLTKEQFMMNEFYNFRVNVTNTVTKDTATEVFRVFTNQSEYIDDIFKELIFLRK